MSERSVSEMENLSGDSPTTCENCSEPLGGCVCQPSSTVIHAFRCMCFACWSIKRNDQRAQPHD
jgi:hypothetical protein